MLALVAGTILLERYVSQVSPGLRRLSRHGIEAFVRYAVGDYAGAAAAYREDLCAMFATAGLPVDDEEVALLQGDAERARILATQAVTRDPRAWKSLLTLGEVALDQDAPGDAVHWIGQSLAVAPGDLDALVIAAVAYARAGDQESAIRMMVRALRDWKPEMRPTTFVRALAETGRLYELPAEQRPACLLALFHRYLRVYDDHQSRPTIAWAEEAIARGDHAGDAYVAIGVIRQKHAEDAIALDAFVHAIDANPHNAEAYRWAAVVYADRGDLVNEYRMARAAYEAEPDDTVYTLPLAHVLADKLGDYRAALDIETKALTAGRITAALLDHLGYLHGMLGNAEDAIAFYRRAAMLAPDEPPHWRGLGWAFTLEDRYDDAIRELRHAVVLNPRWTDARYALALALRHAGRYEDAIPEFERSYIEEPSRRSYLPDLCITYQLAARFDRARACADEFLRMAPWSRDIAFLRSFSLAGALDDGGGR